MQCPICKLNIKDDATICIHCGTRFQNVTYAQQTNQNQQFMSNSQPIPNQQFINQSPMMDREKYLQAYTNGKYEQIKKNSFSLGVFFLGIAWLLFHKLYKDALSMLGKLIALSIITTVIGAVFSLLGLKILVLFVKVADYIAYLWILISYCKDYSYLYIAHANKKIDEILMKTEEENERLRLCKKAGSPNYLILLILLALPLLYFVLMFALAFYTTNYSLNSMEDKTLQDQAVGFANDAKNEILVDDVKPSNAERFQPGNLYYFLINDEYAETFPLRTNIEGYIVVKYEENNESVFFVCVKNKRQNRQTTTIYPSGSKPNDLYKLQLLEKGNCDFEEDIPSDMNVEKVVYR